MNRKCLSFAALVATPLIAHAQSSVTVYGLLDLGLAVENRGAGNVKQASNLAYPSRLGFRGTEDLGDGLKASFVLEGAVAVDTGGAGTTGSGMDWARQALVGLSGAFGEVQLGRGYTPAFVTALNHDNLAYGYYSSLLVFSGGAAGFTTRYSNALFYNTPKFNGFSLRTALALGERSAEPKRLGNAYGLGVTYELGPVTLDAYHQADRVGVPATAPTSAPKRVQKGLGLKWTSRAVTLVMGYGQAETDGLNNRSKGLNIGATVPLGDFGALIAEVVSVKTRAAAGIDPKARSWGLTYQYTFSKRTTLYATSGQTRNNASGNFPLFGTAPSAPSFVGADPRGIGVGATLRF